MFQIHSLIYAVFLEGPLYRMMTLRIWGFRCRTQTWVLKIDPESLSKAVENGRFDLHPSIPKFLMRVNL